ncbi:MAG TPA: PfkB family carbohydrate kinase [Chthoniobacterales bacterium]|nr:PfkB family carbohydrate kinase [Chthoniobacterales bacterium]
MSLPNSYSNLRVLVIGSYNTDLVIACDAIPERGESILGGDFEIFCGGRGANCAVAAARAGCQVKFVGAHGKDMFAKMATDRLARERIDTSDFIELPSSQTGVAMLFQERKTGVHSGLIAASANNQFPAALVRKVESAIRESDLVFTQFEIAPAAVSEVYRLCSHHGTRLVVHAAPVQPPTRLPGGQCHLLVVNDVEAFVLTEQTDVYAAIQELHRRGVRNVIVKEKTRLLTFSDGNSLQTQPIPSVPFVQGAGTVECLVAWAGITLAITNDLACAAYLGAQAMAFSLSRHGAQDSMPYASELPVSWSVVNLGGYRPLSALTRGQSRG